MGTATGIISKPARAVTAATTVSGNEQIIVDASSGAITITGPAAATARRWGVKKADATTNVVGISYVNSAGNTVTLNLTVQDDAKTFEPLGSGYVAVSADRSRTADDARYAKPTDLAVFNPRWQASTSYTQGAYVIDPLGRPVTANSTHTSGATYDSTLWTLVLPPSLGTIDGSRAVFTGDSLTIGDGFQNWPNNIAAISGGKVRMRSNAGHGGYTSTQLQALLATEVWAQNPTVVFCLPGRNDNTSYGYVAPPETIAYVDAIRLGCAARNIPFILVGQPPNGTASLGTPAAPTVTAFTTGGTLAAGTYGYKVAWATGTGTTLPSPATSATVTGSTGSVRVDIPVNQGAASYQVYRETTAGSGTYALLATLSGGANYGQEANKSYLDTGSVTPSGAVASSDGSAVGLDSANQRKQQAITLWLQKYARKYGALYADIFPSLVDVSTGLYITGYTADGTHPSPPATRLIAEAVWAQVSPYFRSPSTFRARANVDPSNRATNPLLMNGTGTPTGWTNTTNTGSGATATSLGTVSGFTGRAFTFGQSDGTTVQEWSSPNSTPASGDSKTVVNGGEIIEWSVKLNITGADTGGGSVLVSVVGTNGQVYQRVVLGSNTTAPAVVSSSFVSDGAIDLKLVVATRNGAIQVTVGEYAIVNLTRTQNLALTQ